MIIILEIDVIHDGACDFFCYLCLFVFILL